jgi:uracil-DNA glycosylase
MTLRLENSWLQAMAPEFEKQYWHDLAEFVKSEYQAGVCYPDPKHIF